MNPTGRTPEGAHLAEVLRELRTRTGLSLAGLAAETAYSKSSWERYLNGKKMPPRDAVEQLCRLAGEPPARCVALWELAEPAWSGRAAPPAPQAPPRVPEPASPDPAAAGEGERDRPRRRNRGVLGWAAGFVVSAGVAISGGVLWPTDGEASRATSETSCSGRSCAGRSAQATRCGMHPDTVRTYRPREGMQLDLRYERDCGAGWARVFGQRTGDVFEVSVPGQSPQRLRIADKYEAEVRISTPMVPTADAQELRVCFTPADGGGSKCFGRGAR